MKKNGFTLIEMLAVVIILTLLTLLIIPNVINSIKSYQSKTDELSMAIIESGADLYIDDYKDDYPGYYGNNYCISLNKLVDLGYLKKPVKYQDEDITDLKTLKITYDDTYEYELVEKGTCITDPLICSPVSEEDLTTGTSPKKDESGNIIFTPGDEYICEVKEDVKYRFFVLSTEGDKVNLIMDRNITSEGYETTIANLGLVDWINQSDYTNAGNDAWSSTNKNSNGPVSALNFIYNATTSWKNVPNIIINYTDNGGEYGYGSIITTENKTTLTTKENAFIKVNNGQDAYIDLKARLPIKNELSGFNSKNLWMYNYLENSSNVTGSLDKLKNIPGIQGYWTLDSGETSSNSAWYISNTGSFGNRSVESGGVGVRPVITITKENINY